MAELRISREGRGDRGQLILVTGFALAFVLVALVLLLNTTIYTENIASRGIDRSPDEAVEFRVAVTDGLRDLIEANEDSEYDEPNFSDTLANFSRMLERGYEDRGTIAVVNNTSAKVHTGTLIRQTNHTRNFSSAQSIPQANWTVAEEIDDMRNVQFKINISESRIPTAGRENAFELQFNDSTDSTNNWSVYIYKTSGGELEVATERNGTGLFGGTCSYSHGGGGNVTIDITNGTLAGEECDILQWWGGNPPESYDLRFVFGNKSSGTYDMLLNDSIPAGDSYFTDSGGPEKIQPALYSLTVRLRYQTSTLAYETNVTIAPGEPENE